MGTYLVTGGHAYHGNSPGMVFQATLDRDAERRAISRGAIQVLDATPPGLIPGSYRPPDGWGTQAHNSEAPKGASSIEGSI